MSNTLITGPAVEPVSVEDFKLFAKIDDTAEDALYEEFLKAAREHFELTTGLATINQAWRLVMDHLPGAGKGEPWWDGVREGAISMLSPARNWIELPTGPLVSVSAFSTYAMDNSVDADFDEYFLDTSSRPGRLVLNSGSVWPVATRGVSGYQVDYVAGFGPDPDNVPSDIKLAIKIIALHFNENREVMTFDTASTKVPLGAERIMARRKIRRV